MSAPDREAFFVGYRLPRGTLARFLLLVGAGLIAAFAGLGWLLAATQDDPGGGSFRWDWGPVTVEGTLEARPYPILHVARSERYPAGRTLLLSGEGKRGAQDRAGALDGRAVTASGFAIRRGALDMIQLRGGAEGLSADGGGAPSVPVPEPLGRWRVTGEICDGKCYGGAMRPGRGLAHRACANLCLTGGVPPVLVIADPIEGQSFLLLAAADGGPVGAVILAMTAVLVEAEGAVERRGDLLVFRLDAETLRLAP